MKDIAACVGFCGITGCVFSLATGVPYENHANNCNPIIFCSWRRAKILDTWYGCLCWCHAYLIRNLNIFVGYKSYHAETICCFTTLKLKNHLKNMRESREKANFNFILEYSHLYGPSHFLVVLLFFFFFLLGDDDLFLFLSLV